MRGLKKVKTRGRDRRGFEMGKRKTQEGIVKMSWEKEGRRSKIRDCRKRSHERVGMVVRISW